MKSFFSRLLSSIFHAAREAVMWIDGIINGNREDRRIDAMVIFSAKHMRDGRSPSWVHERLMAECDESGFFGVLDKDAFSPMVYDMVIWVSENLKLNDRDLIETVRNR